MEVTKENLKINTIKEEKNMGVYSFEPLPTGLGTHLQMLSEEFSYLPLEERLLHR